MGATRFGKFLIAGLLLTGCGKYGPPVPPEALSPARVNDLAVSTAATSVSLSWKAPTKDIRSKELRSIDGYAVQRAVLNGNEPTQFTSLTFIDDRHIRERDRLRDEARAAGKPTRRVTADPQLSVFSFSDTTVVPGGRYVYRIVPMNQGGTAGAVGESIKVTFNGATSEITRVAAADLESELFVDKLSGEEF